MATPELPLHGSVPIGWLNFVAESKENSAGFLETFAGISLPIVSTACVFLCTFALRVLFQCAYIMYVIMLEYLFYVSTPLCITCVIGAYIVWKYNFWYHSAIIPTGVPSFSCMWSLRTAF